MAPAHHAHGDDRAVVNQWLQYLSRRTGIPLALNDDGICAVGHESGLDCVVEAPGDGSVYLRVGILPWEPEADPDLAERCLIGQFMGRDTHGASFGVDPIDGELVLWQERPLVALDETSFSLLVVQILDTAVQWRSGLPAAQEKADLEAAINAERPSDFAMLKA
jgi:hypothetical protein